MSDIWPALLADLEDAETELRRALGTDLVFPASAEVANALRFVMQAQARLQGKL
jgi:hypothetical protein